MSPKKPSNDQSEAEEKLEALKMSPQQFRDWRKAMGLKQKDAADLLGLRKRMIQYYEKGNRDGKQVEIPKPVRLACYALTIGIEDFNGETLLKAKQFGFKTLNETD